MPNSSIQESILHHAISRILPTSVISFTVKVYFHTESVFPTLNLFPGLTSASKEFFSPWRKKNISPFSIIDSCKESVLTQIFLRGILAGSTFELLKKMTHSSGTSESSSQKVPSWMICQVSFSITNKRASCAGSVAFWAMSSSGSV